MKRFTLMNADCGIAVTIKSQYFKMGAANVCDRSDRGGNYKATGIMIEYA